MSAGEWPKAYTILDVQRAAADALTREAERYEREAASAADDLAGLVTRVMLSTVARQLRERATDYWRGHDPLPSDGGGL